MVEQKIKVVMIFYESGKSGLDYVYKEKGQVGLSKTEISLKNLKELIR